MNVVALVRGLVTRLVWLAVVLVVALGAAGAVTAMAHAPGTEARAELTWPGDQAALPALDHATSQLEALAEDVDSLGTTAREALVAVVGGDLAALTDRIERGTYELGQVAAQRGTLDEAMTAVPGMGADAPIRVSSLLRHRFEELAKTDGVALGLEEDWAVLTGRALDAVAVTGLLERHDQETAAAAKEGAAARYTKALDLLDTPDATIARCRKLADQLAKTADVSTLTLWLDRNAAYDAALRTLYQALLDSDGRVTSAVKEALAAETRARAGLPADTRGIVVIMAEIAQGGLNQAVIAIEEARGALAASLEVQLRLQSGSELP